MDNYQIILAADTSALVQVDCRVRGAGFEGAATYFPVERSVQVQNKLRHANTIFFLACCTQLRECFVHSYEFSYLDTVMEQSLLVHVTLSRARCPKLD